MATTWSDRGVSARRALPAVALLLVALAGLALLAHGPDEPAGSAPTSAPSEGAPTTSSTADPLRPPAAQGEAARVASARATNDAAPTTSSEPVAEGRVRLTGRLVAARLEWGWVWAVSADREGLPPPAEVEDQDDAPDLTVDAEGVPTVDPWRAQDREGAAIGRPAWGWAVPRGATRVDRSGAFALDLAPGTWVVLAGARGCSTRVEALRLEVSRDVTWTLEHAAPATLELTCLAAGGEPLAHGRIECVVARERVAPALVAVGEGPWGPISVDAHAEAVDRAETRSLICLDAHGRGHLELPAGPVVLGDGGETDLYGLDVGSTSRDERPVRWDSVRLPAVRATLAAGERREVTLRQPEPEGGAVLVRVRDAAGVPVAGAQVGLADTDDGPAFELLQTYDFATTGPDGRATFLDRPFGATYVVARAGGRSGRSPPRVVQAVGERLEVEVVLDEVDPHGTLLVRALAAGTGAPLAGASVSGAGDDAPSLDLQRRVGPGLVQIDGVPLGRHQVSVVAPGRAARVVEVEVAGGAPSANEVSLEPVAVVSGRIAGSNGAELVWLLKGDDELVSSTQVDSSGAFRFDAGPSTGDRLVVRVFAAFHFPYLLPVRAPAELAITLPGESTAIQVLQTDGAPAAGVQVLVHDADGREVARAVTGQDGRLRLFGRPPAGATVMVQGVAPVPLAPDLVLRRAAESRGGPAPPPPVTAQVSGTVLDLAGRPAVGARVWVHEGHRAHGAIADPEGAFSVRVVIGPIVVVAERADLGRWAQRLELERSGATVVARFQPGVAVRLRAPAPVTSVYHAPAGDWGPVHLGRSSSFRRADGTFDLGLLLPGRWTVVLRDAKRDEVATRTIEVAPPGPLVVTVE